MTAPELGTLGKAENGQILTFYSYKGGVGRSMAVANMAALLSMEGQRVLVLDFDLEAPGLHRYFLNPKPPRGKARYTIPKDAAGVIELFGSLSEALTSRFPDDESYPSDPAAMESAIRQIVDKVFSDPRYFHHVRLDHPGKPKKNVKRHKEVMDSVELVEPIHFVPAGCFDANYSSRVRLFDWVRFYENYVEVFPVLIEWFRQHYDSIIIDSRTGITDIGSICTVLLPDKLVLCFSPNEQSLQGVIEAGRQALQQRNKREKSRPLGLFPLPGRLENAEQELQRQWLADAQQRFEKLFTETFRIPVDLTTYFEQVRIPHNSYHAYGEEIAAERDPPTMTGSLTAAFDHFRQCLRFPSAQFVRWSAMGQVATVLEETASLAKTRNDFSTEAAGYYRLGNLALEQHDLAAAEMWYRKVLSIGEKQGAEPILGMIFFQLGNIALERKSYNEALDFYNKSLAIGKKAGRDHSVLASYGQLGTLALEQNDLETAADAYRKALDIAKRIEDQGSIGTTYHHLGRIAEQQGKPDIARDWYQKAISIKENLGDEYGAATSYGQLGILAYRSAQYAEAGQLLIKALKLFSRNADEHNMDKAKNDFVSIYQIASDEVKEQLRALWDVAGVGSFPVDHVEPIVSLKNR